MRAGCPAAGGDLLRGSAPPAGGAGADGRSPYRLAMSQGRSDLTALLLSYRARDDTTDADHLIAACLRADGASARQQLARHPGLPGRLTEVTSRDATADLSMRPGPQHEQAHNNLR